MKKLLILLIYVYMLQGCTKDSVDTNKSGRYNCRTRFWEYYTVAPYTDSVYYLNNILTVSLVGDSLFFFDSATYIFNQFSIKSKIDQDTFRYFNGRQYGYGEFKAKDSLFLFKQTNITAGILYRSYCKKIN